MNGTGLSYAVIIPVYNGAAFIQRAIESCLQQTQLPNEIIIIDDASNDDTVAVVKSQQSGLVKYKRNQKNSGPSFSRNQGMELASSDWVLFLDADDVFHPQKIEIINYHLVQNAEIRAIGHAFDVIGKKAATLSESEWKDISITNISAAEVLMKNPAVTPSLAVSCANKVLFNEEMVYAEDHDFILRTSEQFGFWYLDLPLCSLQRLPLTPGGISDNKWKMRKGEMRMYMDYCKRHGGYIRLPFLLTFSMLKHIKNMIISRRIQ